VHIENRSINIEGFHCWPHERCFDHEREPIEPAARRLRCRSTRNDRRIGLFIRRAGQISRKIRGIRVPAPLRAGRKTNIG
jgi:hypothetical protein